MLSDGVCGNIFISSWQSRWLSSQCERISILVETKGLVEMVAFWRFLKNWMIVVLNDKDLAIVYSKLCQNNISVIKSLLILVYQKLNFFCHLQKT